MSRGGTRSRQRPYRQPYDEARVNVIFEVANAQMIAKGHPPLTMRQFAETLTRESGEKRLRIAAFQMADRIESRVSH